jgi:hypothetical protein
MSSGGFTSQIVIRLGPRNNVYAEGALKARYLNQSGRVQECACVVGPTHAALAAMKTKEAWRELNAELERRREAQRAAEAVPP